MEPPLTDSQSTRPSLLLRVRDAEDVEAWQQFIDVYGPLIFRFGIRNSLQEADAADLTQDVLVAVSNTIRSFDYDPQLGRFRSWLFTVARNKLLQQLGRLKRHPRGSGDSGLQQAIQNHPQDEDALQKAWDEEFEQYTFEWAAERVRGQFRSATWEAFWATAVDLRSAEEVARELNMTVGAVYIARSRVIARLKEQIEQVTEP